MIDSPAEARKKYAALDEQTLAGLEEGLQWEMAHKRRLARLVLEATWGKQQVEKRLKEHETDDPPSQDG